jgi:hypothetical protein
VYVCVGGAAPANVWVCVYVVFLLGVTFSNMFTSIYCVLYCLYYLFFVFSFMYVFLLDLSVLPPSDNAIAVNNNNNNNNNNMLPSTF